MIATLALMSVCCSGNCGACCTKVIGFKAPLHATETESIMSYLKAKYNLALVSETAKAGSHASSTSKEMKITPITATTAITATVVRSDSSQSVSGEKVTHSISGSLSSAAHHSKYADKVAAAVVAATTKKTLVEESPQTPVKSAHKEDASKQILSEKQRYPEPEPQRLESDSLLKKETGVSEKQGGNEKAGGGVCLTHVDPHKDAPVQGWKPPAAADYKEVLMWEYKVSDLEEKVRKMKVGGNKLREVIKSEVRELQLLRFQTFCKYY